MILNADKRMLGLGAMITDLIKSAGETERGHCVVLSLRSELSASSS